MGNKSERESYDADEIYAYVGLKTPKAFRAVEKILKCNPQLVNKLHQGRTLLDEPCRKGYAKMVSLLLDLGVFVNLSNKYGRSPVMTATIYGNCEAVKVLCERGAIIDNVFIVQEMSIFDLAIYRGYYQTAAYLYKKIANKNIKQITYYESLAKKYNSRYVNYEIFIEGLKAGKSIEQLPDFLTKKKVSQQKMKANDYLCCCCEIFYLGKNKQSKKEINSERQSLQFEQIINSQINIEYRSSKSFYEHPVNPADIVIETDRNLSMKPNENCPQKSS